MPMLPPEAQRLLPMTKMEARDRIAEIQRRREAIEEEDRRLAEEWKELMIAYSFLPDNPE